MILPLADMGCPMLFVQAPVLINTLPIVIVIETLICAKSLRVPLKNAFGAATFANIVSTVIGFPVLWVALVILQMLFGGGGFSKLAEPWFSIYSVTVQAAWLVPNDEQDYWMIPAAMLVLMVPTFFMSVLVERFFYRLVLKERAPDANFRRASWIMHLASYAFLVAVGAAFLVYALVTHKK